MPQLRTKTNRSHVTPFLFSLHQSQNPLQTSVYSATSITGLLQPCVTEAFWWFVAPRFRVEPGLLLLIFGTKSYSSLKAHTALHHLFRPAFVYFPTCFSRIVTQFVMSEGAVLKHLVSCCSVQTHIWQQSGCRGYWVHAIQPCGKYNNYLRSANSVPVSQPLSHPHKSWRLIKHPTLERLFVGWHYFFIF